MREDLSRLEQWFVDVAARGGVADCASTDTTPDALDSVTDWTERVIRAEVVALLVTGEDSDYACHPRKGLRLRGALITGQLDLAHANLERPIAFEVCRFEEPVDLSGARVGSLTMTGCDLPALLADELETDRSLSLSHSSFSSGPVRLPGARIRGNLELTGARLAGTNERRHALVGDRLHAGAALLDGGFEASGTVHLPGATIDSFIDMGGAKLNGTDKRGNALRAVGMKVGDEVFLSDGFEAAGAIGLRGARVGGNLELTGAKLTDTDVDGNAFVGDGLSVGGGARFRKFEAAGTVRLWGARIGAQLDLRGAKLASPDRKGDALVAGQLHGGANVLMTDKFEAAGAVSLRGATIDGSLELDAANLAGTDADGNSLRAARLHVRGSFHIRNRSRLAGDLRLVGAHIESHFVVTGECEIRRLALRSARCGSIRHDEDSWPRSGDLVVPGFRFDALVGDTDWRLNLEWARRQGFDNWSPDPYEQLAKYYTGIGNETAARRLRIAKQDDELTHLKTVQKTGSMAYRFWRRPFGWLVGYGYRRWPAGLLLVLTLLIAGGLFQRADDANIMTPSQQTNDVAAPQMSCGDTHPCFNAAVYGADVVLPIIDFGQDSTWRPNERTAWGQWAAGARWVFIALGWLLASVFVAAFTRLVQRD